MKLSTRCLAIVTLGFPILASAGEIAITMDDPNHYATPVFSASKRDSEIRKALETQDVQAALFVCGTRVDSPEGKALLKEWDKAGHLLANHTYSHRNLNDPKETSAEYELDIAKAESLLKPLAQFTKIFRFPFLKEGETRAKRDSVRRFLKNQGYAMGYVTVDASDWYIDSRLADRLRKDPSADLKPFREFYLNHIWDRVTFYDALARKTGRNPKHTLLVHHNLLNALFLGDVMKMLESKGWKIIDASAAFRDPIQKALPDIAPAGESIVWALAKESKCCDSLLRYPGEDGAYEKAAMDALNL